MGDVLGLIGIFVGLAFLVWAIFKGFSLVIAAPVATMIVVLFNGLPFYESVFTGDASYMAALVGFLKNNFPVFLFGAILAKYMDKSGAAVTIAEKLMQLVGTSSPYRALVSLFVIAAVLTYGGINIFVVIFILIPLAKPIFKEYDLPWKLVIAPIFGGGATFTMTMLPFSPSLHNAVLANALGTPLSAAPILGTSSAILSVAFVLWYMGWDLKASRKKGETYSVSGDVGANPFDRVRPSFGPSFAPILLLLLLILVFTLTAVIPSGQALVYALMAAIVLAAVLFRNYTTQKDAINQGTADALTSVLATGSTIAFGSFAVSVPAFQGVKEAIVNVPGNPMIGLMLGTMVLALITASSVGSEGISLSAFAPGYVAQGVDPALIHRATAIAGGISLAPHNGFLNVFNGLAGFTLKDSYGRAFIAFHVPHFIGMFLVVVLSSIGVY